MISKDQQDSVSSEVASEKYDIPIVVYRDTMDGFDTIDIVWKTPINAKTYIDELFKNPIPLSDEQINSFEETIQNLSQIYSTKLPISGYFLTKEGRILNSITCQSPGPKLYIYSGDVYFRGKVTVHNLDKTEDALFFIECLAEYLRYQNLEFPYIKTQRENNTTFHTFSLPLEDDRQEIRFLLEKFSSLLNSEPQDIYVSEKGIFLKGQRVAFFTKNRNDDNIIQSDKLNDINLTTKLFDILSKPLRKRLWNDPVK